MHIYSCLQYCLQFLTLEITKQSHQTQPQESIPLGVHH